MDAFLAMLIVSQLQNGAIAYRTFTLWPGEPSETTDAVTIQLSEVYSIYIIQCQTLLTRNGFGGLGYASIVISPGGKTSLMVARPGMGSSAETRVSMELSSDGHTFVASNPTMGSLLVVK